MELRHRVFGHPLLHLLVFSYCSLIHLLHTTRCAHALSCAHSPAHSLTRSWALGKEAFIHDMKASISYIFSPSLDRVTGHRSELPSVAILIHCLSIPLVIAIADAFLLSVLIEGWRVKVQAKLMPRMPMTIRWGYDSKALSRCSARDVMTQVWKEAGWNRGRCVNCVSWRQVLFV